MNFKMKPDATLEDYKEALESISKLYSDTESIVANWQELARHLTEDYSALLKEVGREIPVELAAVRLALGLQ